ncbi:DUF975 family protein [Iodobacter sp.]|uniref:DUF975 family protein n=1 Tax=Iodobacter sp. TaxID=1915058 RepID=UPI0025CC267F|nr:DUF975 family protein [Iodobacter sp.]
MIAVSSISNQDLMTQARDILRGKWTTPVLVSLVYVIVIAILNQPGVIPAALSLLVSGPIALGFTYFYLAIIREQKVDTNLLAKGFTEFIPSLLTYLLTLLLIILWMILLIIPGIMAAYSYALVFYIRRDQPELDIMATLNRSKALMYGNRWKLCYLHFRFFGWFLLSIITCGIGFLWFLPYIQTTSALFYEDLIQNEQSPQQ